jgi:putative transcriptional regulator
MKKHSAGQPIAPGFLIASPKLDDSPFERAVVAMVRHDDQGAMGFIVNKPMDLERVDFGSLLAAAHEEIADQIVESCYKVPLYFGGPVRTDQLWLIQRSAADWEQGDLETEEEGELMFAERWHVLFAATAIEAVARGHRVAPYRPFMGYAGWGPGQLEDEMEDGAWLFLPWEEAFLFPEDAEGCWARALAEVGVEPMAFLMMGKVGMA